MSSRLSLTFILITVLIDAMGIGLIMPVMPDLLREVQGGTLADAVIWGGILSTSFAVMQFIFGPTLGSLSDAYGRRPVLLFALFFMALDYLVMAVAGTIWLLLIGRIVGGITAATQSTAAAFIADISPPEKKAANFGLIGAAFGLGFVLGPLIGGLLGELGPRAPFYAAAALSAANFVFGWLILPETVTDKIRRPFQLSRANPLGAFRAVSKLPNLRRLMATFLVYEIAFFVYPSVWAYFTTERFGWDSRMIGVSLASFGIAMAVVQGGLIRVILARLGERGAVIYGFVFNALAFLLMAIVTNPILVLILTPITALGAVVTPAMRSIMSKAVGDDQQGELQGVLASISAVSMIAAPLVMTQIFAFFTREGTVIYAPGAPFVLSMVLMFVCLAIFLLGRGGDVAEATSPRSFSNQKR